MRHLGVPVEEGASHGSTVIEGSGVSQAEIPPAGGMTPRENGMTRENGKTPTATAHLVSLGVPPLPISTMQGPRQEGVW